MIFYFQFIHLLKICNLLLLISWSVSPIPSESTKKGYELDLKSGPLLHKKWPSYDA